MTNLDKYAKAFVDTFDVDPAVLPTSSYPSIPVWDSIGHMSLMAKLQEPWASCWIPKTSSTSARSKRVKRS